MSSDIGAGGACSPPAMWQRCNCDVDVIQHIDISGKHLSCYSDRRFERTPITISTSPKRVPNTKMSKLPQLTVTTKIYSYFPGQTLFSKRGKTSGKALVPNVILPRI